MSSPAASYLICATQRSGSNLLCHALSDTGVAGHPEEYFLTGPPEAFPPGWKFWEEGPLAVKHGVRTRAEYLDLVCRVGSTPNGVFGAKLMFNNVEHVLDKFREMPAFTGLDAADIFHAVFPGLRVVHLTRNDRVRQAVSWARAAQDGVWVVTDAKPARAPAMKPLYSYDFIADLLGLIEAGERGWLLVYEALGIEPLHVTYEQLTDSATYVETVRSVLEHLRVWRRDVDIYPPRTRRQADALNEEWAQRFLEERGGSPG